MMEILKQTEQLISKNKPFEYWQILERGEKESEKLVQGIAGNIAENVSVSGAIHLGKDSVIKSGTVIEGPVYIGDNCTIGPHAFLRKGTIIASNCHIGSSEIKNSIILSGTNVPHFSYVGDSIIGRNCNFGAGTKIANLRYDGKNVKVKIWNKNIDSKRRKLGALIFDDVKTGINSSINCGAIIKSGSRIKPNEFVK